ncbi:MAG: hypothetical protein V1787_02675 [Candidatus Micrarchaeota archaeon]
MERTINWSAYVLAFVVSILVFAVGVLLGIQLNQQAGQQLSEELDRLRFQTAETEVLALITKENLNSSPGALCSLYDRQIARLNEETSRLGQTLTVLEASRGASDADVRRLKADYFLLEIRDFLFVKQVNRECGDRFATILYFYDNSGCASCERQGETLSQVKAGDPSSILVYSFDAALNSSAVQLLRDAYGIALIPSVVVNGRLYSGPQEADQIRRALS